jgi:hypothetical protein
LFEWKTALEQALAQAPNAALVMGHNGIFHNDATDVYEGAIPNCWFLAFDTSDDSFLFVVVLVFIYFYTFYWLQGERSDLSNHKLLVDQYFLHWKILMAVPLF